MFSISEPRAWLCYGRAEWLTGRQHHAHEAWLRSLSAATRLRMPFEEASAHYVMGRLSAADDPERRGHLESAREIFTKLGVTYELDQVERLMGA